MPSWKKVITSGSNAVLAQITASDVPVATTQNLLAIDTSSGGFMQISQSSVNALGDNLGNHTATEDLTMSTFSVQGATNITASGTVESNVFEIKSGSYSTYEHFHHVNVGNINVGNMTLTTLKIPGVSSISENFHYMKITHVATDASDSRTQVMTTHAAWQRNSANEVSNLKMTSTEEIKSPLNEVIIDPSRTTGSFDSNGNLNLSVYHYNVDNAFHKLTFTVI
jgi:hypothetical protein